MEAAEVMASAVRLAAEGSRDSDEYWDLIQTLHRIPEQHVFDLAAACCIAASATERAVGADVLAQLGLIDSSTGKRPFTDPSVPILRTLLHDADEGVLTSAIHALAHHGVGTAKMFRDLAHHDSADVRYAVSHALGSIPPGEEELTLIFELMQDPSDKVRDWATFVLGSQCDVDTSVIREALKSRLEDPDDSVRGEAMVGLARRGDSSVGPAIVRELRSEGGILAVDAAQDFLERYPENTSVHDALAKWRAGS